MNNAEDLIAKVKALAQEGVAGEKENAQIMLEKLCRKYNISLDDLDDEAVSDFDIGLGNNAYERSLLHQVFYSVVGNLDDRKKLFKYTKYRNKGFLTCTKAEFLETQAKFNFYRYHLKKDMDMFYDAFIQQNRIFPPDDKCKPKEEKFFLTDEDLKMLKLAGNLDKHDYNLQVEYKEEI